jgi:hypothetical protein
MSSGETQLMFWRNISPPSSRLFFFCYLFHAGFLLDLQLFGPADKASMFILSDGKLSPDYMALYPKI